MKLLLMLEDDHQDDVEVVDADLGRSGTTIEHRKDCQELVGQIAGEKSGVLPAFDETRPARNCSHWY